MNKEQAIALWKEKGISRAEMNFYCGGDEMGEVDFSYYDKDDKQVDCNELYEYFDDDILNNSDIEFYVNSDGHYIGESGIVYIDVDTDDEEYFSYTKSSESEWNEEITNTLEIELTDEQVNYIKEYISSFNGDSGGNMNFNYSKDFIMTDEHERIEREISDIVENKVTDFEPETDDEVQEWFNYQNEEPMFNDDNELLVELTNSITVFKTEYY